MWVPLNYRNIARNEVKIYTIIIKSFKRQFKFLIDNLEDLYTNYQAKIELEYWYLQRPRPDIYEWNMYKWWGSEISSEPLDWFWRAMWIYDMIEDVKPQVRWAVEKWYKKMYRLFEDDMRRNGFSYQEAVPIDYMNKFWELNLSNYKWSISLTTKNWVTEILKNWLDNNLWIWDIAKQITELDGTLFNKARAKLIATTEVGRAYEYWNNYPMQQLNNVWINIIKKRQTVNDSRVRPEHMENELEWRQPLNYIYPATGCDIPPAAINCRCTVLYEIEWANK